MRSTTEADLAKGLRNRDYVLHYQPTFSLVTNEIVGAGRLPAGAVPTGRCCRLRRSFRSRRGRPRDCAFGRWYVDANGSPGATGTCRALAAPHADLHRLGKGLVHRVRSGAALHELAPMLSQLKQVSNEPVRLLEDLEDDGLHAHYGGPTALCRLGCPAPPALRCRRAASQPPMLQGPPGPGRNVR